MELFTWLLWALLSFGPFVLGFVLGKWVRKHSWYKKPHTTRETRPGRAVLTATASPNFTKGDIIFVRKRGTNDSANKKI